MPGVFVSYCRPCAQIAERVTAALSSMGYDVWRDDQLPAHRAYGDVIEEKLRAASAVVVLWSSDACQSQWVRAEADYARQAGTLVQASLDGTIPPLPFNQIQCADLSGWEGDGSPGWRKIEQSVAELAPLETDANEGRFHRDRPSICVLPFQNMSGDAEQEYFSDGISEDITTDLSKVSSLSVTARNTAFTYKGKAVNVAELARTLGVSHVLEGSVRKSGERVRISAQLIDGRTGDHVWAERYDRDLTDIFAIQDEISKAIVGALKLKLLPEEKRAIEQRGTTSAEAYNFYLMARQYWVTGSHGDPRREERVSRICRKAVEIDPDYARAWALMALAEANLRVGYGRSGEGGLAAAERALALDPNVAEAYCARAQNLAHDGKLDQANRELEKALTIEPESWEANKVAGRLSMLQRRIPEATRYFEKAVSLMEGDYHSWGMLITCYRAAGDERLVQHAARMLVERAEKVLDQDPSNGAALGMIANGLAILGEKDRAKDWIDRAMLIEPDNRNTRYNFACVLANELNDQEAAIDMLEPAFTQCGEFMIRLAETDPDFDVLRDLPRFQKLKDDAYERLGIRPNPDPAGAATPHRS